MKKTIHMTRPGLIELVLLLACLAIPINSNAQMFGGSMIPSRGLPDIIPVIPTNLTLGQNEKYFVSSVYDENYLPFTFNTAPASTGIQNADTKAEAIIIDVQGIIPATGITVSIPVTATGSGTLPAYRSTISIPANLNQGGISHSLRLSWSAQAYTYNTKYITATLAAVGGDLNAKKLDINCGLGDTYQGVLMGSFSYPYNNAGTMTTFAVRDIAAIPDKMFGENDNHGSQTHNFLYLPITAEDGKIWLNNNLGAAYSKYQKSSTNYTKQATAFNDYQAYGSLFQWGRRPDGHDVINRIDGTNSSPIYGTTPTKADYPTNELFILGMTSGTDQDWRQTSNNNLWEDQSYPYNLGPNNPCPTGFEVPTNNAISALISVAEITNPQTAAASDLHFTGTGQREMTDGSVSNSGVLGFYWSSTTNGTFARSIEIEPSNITYPSLGRATGSAVRCIRSY